MKLGEGHRDREEALDHVGDGGSEGFISDWGVLHLSSGELLNNPAIFRQYELLKDPNVREILRGGGS